MLFYGSGVGETSNNGSFILLTYNNYTLRTLLYTVATKLGLLFISLKMSTTKWFSVTTSIRNAVHLINELEDAKMDRLLVRIIQKLHLKNESPFSEEEEKKLQAAFNMSGKQISSVLDTISYILEQSAYHVAKPNVLSQQLQTLELQEQKIQRFVNIWKEHGQSVIELFRKRSLAPKQLDTVNWQLRLQTAQASQTKVTIPSTIFELGLNRPDNEEKEKLQFEFTHEELYKFFQQLEDVQASLDSLNK
ncbi:COMM domain-containing protein 10-like [Hydractinia symbiolongicarpus]|uniref:COMM domain-containing protein 10-like n=1 Tax=Hydractinia symbiolongicarpus TaxID=13093 RepID=UPI00254B88F1|nr:COMM domain-containing protein 10-like [Hydractinia symbiolongicarpus]